MSTDKTTESLEQDSMADLEEIQLGDHLIERTVLTHGGPMSSFAQLHSRSPGLHTNLSLTAQQPQVASRNFGGNPEGVIQMRRCLNTQGGGEGTGTGGQVMQPP